MKIDTVNSAVRYAAQEKATPQEVQQSAPERAGIPQNVLKGAAPGFQHMHGAFAGIAGQFMAPGETKLFGNVEALRGGLTMVDKSRAWSDVPKLDQAEALAQDAFQRSKQPGASQVDKLRAQEEMQQAGQIRKSVEQDLSPLQRQALEDINKEEQAAVGAVDGAVSTGGLGSGVGIGAFLEGDTFMKNGAKDSKSLDDWINGQ